VHLALQSEIKRQVAVLRAGGTIRQETRRWDAEAGVTEPMRSKEYAHDYRYFPDPDLPPVALAAEQVDEWRAALPELPARRRARFVEQYGLPDYDAGVLVAAKRVADFYEETARLSGNFKAASNWIMTDVLRVLAEQEEPDPASLKLTPAALAELIKLVDEKAINMPAAKDVFAELLAQGGAPREIVARKGLAQVSDSGAIAALADQVIAANAKVAEDFRKGKQAALQFLVGQVMKLSRGKANPQLAAELLKQKLTG
jgi:aspartyl-tRNA(Asn)/glutamyl-tRNA(Gln) amidotransferase subunit B